MGKEGVRMVETLRENVKGSSMFSRMGRDAKGAVEAL